MTTQRVGPLDVRDAVAWIESRWGYEKSWKDWESIADEFGEFTLGALKESLHVWYKRGTGRAPKPDQLRKLVGEIQQARIERGQDSFERVCFGDHVWADPFPMDDDRHQVCVLCGERGLEVKCDHRWGPNGRCFYCLEEAS